MRQQWLSRYGDVIWKWAPTACSVLYQMFKLWDILLYTMVWICKRKFHLFCSAAEKQIEEETFLLLIGLNVQKLLQPSYFWSIYGSVQVIHTKQKQRSMKHIGKYFIISLHCSESEYKSSFQQTETGNLLQPWREQLISPCFLPSRLCKLTHREVGSQKLCSLFLICFLRTEERPSRSHAHAEPFGNVWLCWSFTATWFLSLLPYILRRIFPLPAGAGTQTGCAGEGGFGPSLVHPCPITPCGHGTLLPSGMQRRCSWRL